jgi:CRISPR/Cas system-associated exonuclease Cas4 (RecB family)
MTNPVVLSGTSLQTFLRCGHQWYLANIVQLKSPPNVRMVLGIAAHSAVEHNMAQKIVTKADVSVEEMVDVFSDNFDGAVDAVEDDEDHGKAKDDGIGLVKLHRREVSPLIQPIWVEEAGQLEINDIPYAWTVDIVDDKGRIRDTKTKMRKPTLEENMLQMTGYALGYRERTGLTESDVVIDGLVRTKVPQYVPLYYGGSVNDERIDAFASALGSVAEAINVGSFPPNGLNNGACSWCGYASVCKYRKGR